jgi:hypothetical protein
LKQTKSLRFISIAEKEIPKEDLFSQCDGEIEGIINLNYTYYLKALCNLRSVTGVIENHKRNIPMGPSSNTNNPPLLPHLGAAPFTKNPTPTERTSNIRVPHASAYSTPIRGDSVLPVKAAFEGDRKHAASKSQSTQRKSNRQRMYNKKRGTKRGPADEMEIEASILA